MTFLNATYNKFQDFINQNETSLPPLKTITNTAIRIHGELKTRIYQYLNPKSVELCSKLVHAIPMTLVLNTLSLPQTIIVSAISFAGLWSCKKEFLNKDSKINILHSMAIVFFSNIVSYSTEISLGMIFRLPVNAALLAGSLLLADKIEEAKERDNPTPIKPVNIKPVISELATQQVEKQFDQLSDSLN